MLKYKADICNFLFVFGIGTVDVCLMPIIAYIFYIVAFLTVGSYAVLTLNVINNDEHLQKKIGTPKVRKRVLIRQAIVILVACILSYIAGTLLRSYVFLC